MSDVPVKSKVFIMDFILVKIRKGFQMMGILLIQVRFYLRMSI